MADDGQSKPRLRVLFLDIDGVVNTVHCAGGCITPQLNATLVHRVTRLLELSQAKLVLSTTWRLHPAQMRTLLHALHLADVPFHCILGTTGSPYSSLEPVSPAYSRAAEVLAAVARYAETFDIVAWVAMDDLDLSVHPAMSPRHFVHVSPDKGFTLDDMRRALSSLGENEPSMDTALPPFWIVLEATSVSVVRATDKSLVATRDHATHAVDEDSDSVWARLHQWVHATTAGQPFLVVTTQPQSIQSSPLPPHAMLLLHDAVARPSTWLDRDPSSMLRPLPRRRLQHFDRFVVLQGFPSAESSPQVHATIVNAVTAECECTMSWPTPSTATMALLRHLDDWLCDTVAGLSWLMVGASVAHWVDACAQAGLPCPAYFYTWHAGDIAGDTTSSLAAALNQGHLVVPTGRAPVEVDWPLVCRQSHFNFADILDVRPSDDVVHAIVDMLPLLRAAPFPIRGGLVLRLAALRDWSARQILAEYIGRGDIPNDHALEVVMSMVDMLTDVSSEVDDLLW
ncbi:Aste57867_9199 [Aphanomyces stellatus]|uniref:Aste57867_9199 protein n=1 Tax=Aphanomyces stellatus TaxID=120398 RepID=A0A485KMG8_9STRA|nr:hypothetical protein As57867_009163 [Aphanomyces stellatus]VFT86082.1 Aste57867_9199 [Aphanomyces stellatus]